MRLIYRALVVVVLGLFALIKPEVASAAGSSCGCGFSIHVPECPYQGDLSQYDSYCSTLCGVGAYAGACTDCSDPPASAYIVCYLLS